MRFEASIAALRQGACLLAGLLLVHASAQAGGTVDVVIDNGAVTIRAENASVRNILEGLSRESGLVVRSRPALDEETSLDIEQVSLESAVRRLLRHHSFVLQQTYELPAFDRRDRGPVGMLWILAGDGGQGGNGTAEWSSDPLSSRVSVVDDDTIDFKALAASGEARDRQEAMYAIADSGEPTDIAYLAQGLVDGDRGVREAAILGLAEFGGAEAVQTLALALDDPDVGLRADAVDALGSIGSPEAVELLREATMRQVDPGIREAAAMSLVELQWQPRVDHDASASQ